MMIQALAIVTPIENGTGKRGVGCVGYFAMGAPASGVGVGSVSGRGGCFTRVRLGPVGAYPAGDGCSGKSPHYYKPSLKLR